MPSSWIWRDDTRRIGATMLTLFVGVATVLPFILINYTKSGSSGSARSTMVVMSLTKARASAKPAQKPSVVAKQMPLSNDVPSSAPEPNLSKDTMAGDNSCTVSSQIALAVSNDALATQAIATMPPELKSLSDAIMLWNGQWAHVADVTIADPVAPIRSAVVREIEALPVTCQQTSVTGPVFIAVPDHDHVTTLVFGSGVWRWSDLLKPDPTLPATVVSQSKIPE